MLPPVQATPSTMVQSRVPQRQEHEGQSRHGHGQMQNGAASHAPLIGLSATPATNVNFLNLAAPASMSMDLSRLSQAIGKALNLALNHNEPPASLMKQVAKAILALPAPARHALERQLSTILQGLPLQLVAHALKNPAGNEAARVVAFLELSRREKDAVTQSVVASYQQNEVSEEDDFGHVPPRAAAKSEVEHRPLANASQLEAQLSQAAQAAALKAGIALPLVPYALESPVLEEDEELRRDASRNGNDEAEADDQAEDDEAGDLARDGEGSAQSEADEAEALDAAAPEDSDDPAYSFYARMSGDI